MCLDTCIFLDRDSIVSSRFSISFLTQIQDHWPEPRSEAHLVCSELREGSSEGRAVWLTTASLVSDSAPHRHQVTTVGQLVSDTATGNRIPIFLDGKTEAQRRLITQAGPRSRQSWGVMGGGQWQCLGPWASIGS